MTTRSILGEQVIRKLAGGTPPANFPITEQDAGKQIDQITNAAIKISCLQDGTWDNYLTTYENVPIILDTNTNLYYCVLPAKVISFKDQQGVFQVSTMQDQMSIFLSTTANSRWLSGNKLNQDLQGNVGYYNQQNKLYFVNYNPANDTDTLLLKLVVDRSVFDDEEDYQIPPDLEELIIEKAFTFYSGK